MGNDDDKKPKTKGKSKSVFGRCLEMLPGRKKKSGPTPEEIDQEAANKLSLDRKAVTELKNRLGAVGAPVPPVIELALAAADPRLPPRVAVQEGQKRVDEALQAKDAVETYLTARAGVTKAKDQGGLLKFGSHALLQEFSSGLDELLSTAEQQWQGASNSAQATRHSQSLASQLTTALNLRTEVHNELSASDKEIAAAESAIEKVSGIGSIDVSGVKSKVTQARQLFNGATHRNEIADALKSIQGWKDEVLSATKGQSKSLDKLASYKQLRQSVLDQIGKASVMRGATEDTPMRALLNSARIDIDLADEAMATSSGGTMYDKAKELLEPHKNLLDRAKRIEADLKKKATADLEALPKYTDALQALVRAREQIAGLPGASEQLKQADIALAAARLGTDGQPPGGYLAALKLIEGKADALLKEATKMSETFVKDRTSKVPGLAAAREKADTALLNFINVHPPAQAGAQREALAKALAQDDPSTALGTLAAQWDRMSQAQRDADQQLFTEREKLDQLIADVVKAEAPEAVLLKLRDTEAIERLRKANEFGQALAMAQRMTKAARDYLNIAKQVNSQWTDAKKLLNEASEMALRWTSWPSLKNEANSIIGDAKRTFEAVANGDDRQRAIRAARRIKERAEALDLQAEAQNLDPQADLSGYDQAVETAKAGWTKAAQPVRQALGALAQKLTSLGAGGSAEATTWHMQFKALEERWAHALAHPKLDKDQTPQDALAKLLEQFEAEAKILTEGAAKAKDDPLVLGPLLTDAKDQDLQNEMRELHAKLAAKVVVLESANVKVKAFWDLIGRSFDPAQAAKYGAKWKQLGPALELTLENRRKELNELNTLSLEKADALDKKLTAFFNYDQVRFAGFFDDLRGRSEDARAMVMSNDPTLMAAGQRMIDQLAETLTQARKGDGKKGGEESRTFDDVAELWATLSKNVGQKVLMSRLPATYNRLYGELKAATTQAKSVPPAQGWQLLDALRVPIDDALAQAGLAAERYAIFKERKSQIEEKLVELHKLTATRFTEKTEAYNAQVETRLSSAKQMAKQEGQMDAAFALLDRVDKELSRLMASPETAREELQKLDGEAAAEQRELRDMARSWEQQRLYWSDTLLPQVKKAMAKRGEENFTEYEDLKAAVSRAGAPLKGYLALISSLPHEYLAANSSPDMSQARAAFTSAHGRLMQLQKVANRLINGGGTTNVELEQDLQKLEDEWINRVQRLQNAFGRLAGSIRAMPDQVGTDPNDEATYLDGKALGPLKTAANLLGRSIPGAAARFSPSAFSSALSVLRSPGSPVADRKKAREDALRTMRLLRDEMVGSEMFKMLFEGASTGKLGVDVRPELGLVRASLKKIELAVLVAA